MISRSSREESHFSEVEVCGREMRFSHEERQRHQGDSGFERRERIRNTVSIGGMKASETLTARTEEGEEIA